MRTPARQVLDVEPNGQIAQAGVSGERASDPRRTPGFDDWLRADAVAHGGGKASCRWAGSGGLRALPTPQHPKLPQPANLSLLLGVGERWPGPPLGWYLLELLL